MTERTYNLLRRVLAVVVTVWTFVVYAMTVAATFSYWDCGEFVACSYILGIPHPPGTPLLVLIGRVSSILPFAADIALRVNYVSVVSCALAAGLGFLVLVRMIRAGLQLNDGPLEPWRAVVALCGGFSGALFMAFSNTHWNNAVEAEAYGPAMLCVLILMWLAMRWSDRRQMPRSGRYLVAIAYVGMLSIGFHMTAFLAMPAIFLFLVSVEPDLRRDWRFWLTGFALFLVAGSITLFVIVAGLWLVISVAMSMNRRNVARWGLIAAIMVSGWIGYSTHLYLPIRSAHDPWIDENDPETLESFKGFLERKQYGQTSMFERMLTRRGQWINQIGEHPHMGFYHYFRQQYGFDGWMMIPVMLIGFYGALWLIRRRMPWGTLIAVLFLLGSLGLILYMNFADGTHYSSRMPDAYLEVRNRDYFFTPGFIIFGMMMGLGLAALAGRIGETSAGGRRVAAAIAIVAALLPVRTMAENWRSSDRSRNHTPYDYAWNLLQSCGPNAILFTSGDNDTFPVWCIQEVYGVRKDIAVVNLSLAQTDWYIYQMKHQWGLPITLTDHQILWTVSDPALDGLKRPRDPYDDPVGKSRHYLFAYRDKDGSYVPINHQIVEHVLINNNWERPVYFSSGPGGKSRLPLQDRTRMIGQAQQVVRDTQQAGQDYEGTAALLDSVFLMRGYNDPTIGLDDNAVGLAVAFPEKMIGVAEHYRRQGDTALWGQWLSRARATFPAYYRTHQLMSAHWNAVGDSTRAQEVIQDGLDTVRAFVSEMPSTRLYWYFLGKMEDAAGNDDAAEEALGTAFWMNPTEGVFYQDYVNLLVRHGNTYQAGRASAKWLEYNPNDQRARQMVGAARTAGDS
ncbi:MAG TPA: DUF2723 domain-containing protein [candidate division Zixibacteria bacterium]|jgi:tetratricopeptide (TPR) repeat protein